jgi:hypothetical protein
LDPCIVADPCCRLFGAGPNCRGAPEQRSDFAEELKHIAADLYLDGAAILGEKPPGDVGLSESGSSTVRTKPEIIAYVKAAFAYMHRAAAAIDDANALIPKPKALPYGNETTTRLRIAIANCGHTNDHYGQLVEYLRMNGIVPPDSRKVTRQH